MNSSINNLKTIINKSIRYYTTAVTTKTKCYELKTYNVLPNQMEAFLELTKNNISIKSKQATLLGYWKTEMGCGQSQIVNLWEYSSLDDRMELENKLSNDKEWQSKYQSKVVNLIEKQENLILREFDWAPFKKITSAQQEENQVWELRTYTTKPGKMGQWAIDFTKGFSERKKYSEPVGVFYSEIGALNSIVHLWPYKNFEDRFRIRGEALKNQTWVTTVVDTATSLDTMKSKTLIPIKL